MNRFFLTLSITFALLLAVGPVSSSDVLDNIASGIRSGSASDLAKFFDDNVDITIVDKESVYSKAQAQLVLKDFFQKHPVSSFNLIHRGTSTAGSLYGIGTFTSSAQIYPCTEANGCRSARIYYFVKSKNGNYVLQDLRFEKVK